MLESKLQLFFYLSAQQMTQSISPEPRELDQNIWEVKDIDRKQILKAAKGM